MFLGYSFLAILGLHQKFFGYILVHGSDFPCKKIHELEIKALHTFRTRKKQKISLLKEEKNFDNFLRVLNLVKFSLSLKFTKMSTL